MGAARIPGCHTRSGCCFALRLMSSFLGYSFVFISTRGHGVLCQYLSNVFLGNCQYLFHYAALLDTYQHEPYQCIFNKYIISNIYTHKAALDMAALVFTAKYTGFLKEKTRFLQGKPEQQLIWVQ